MKRADLVIGTLYTYSWYQGDITVSVEDFWKAMRLYKESNV